MKNVAQIVDQRNNEIHEYWYSTNVDETTYICNYGSKSNLLLPRFGMIKYPLLYLRSTQGSITLIIKSLKIIIDVIVSHIWIAIISSNLVHTIIRQKP